MLCDYGCGKEGKFIQTTGKICCSKHYNSCPKSKSKNSLSLKKCYKEKKRPIPTNFSYEAKCKMGRNSAKIRLEKMKTLPWDEAPISEKCRRVSVEQNNKCLICGIDKWLDKEIILHLDHKDGNSKNFNRENLRYICPNCHSQTETYGAKNIKRKHPNYNGKHVSDEELTLALKETKNIHQALIKVGLVPKGRNYSRVQNLYSEKIRILL